MWASRNANAEPARTGRESALGLVPVRSVLRGLPGEDQHPTHSGLLAREDHGPAQGDMGRAPGPRGASNGCNGQDLSEPAAVCLGAAGGGTGPAAVHAPGHDPALAWPALGLDGHAGLGARAEAVVPGLVAKGAVVSEARSAILARLQGALADVPVGEDPSSATVERQYRRTLDASPDQLVDTFA